MLKRTLIISIALVFTAALVSCDGQDAAVGSPVDDLPTISVVTMKVGTGNFDGEMIAQALDDYAAPLIGAHISLEYVENEHYNQVFSTYIASNSMPDTFLVWSADLETQLIENGQLAPLDELLSEYGSAIPPFVGEELLSAHVYGGLIYAVANMMNRAQCLCFEYRKNIADTFGLDMASVESLEDLTAVLMGLKEKSDKIVPMSSFNIRTWDPLSDSLGVLMHGGQSTKVVNLYDTEEYRYICHVINRWRADGLLLDRDYGLTSINNFVRSPEFFGKLGNYGRGLSYVDSSDSGNPIECVILGEPFITTDASKRGCWGISAGSKHPVESMKFLNLMYSDPNVVNLLIFGIEGVHYEIVDPQKGVIDFPEGMTVESSGYAQFRGYHYGNQFIGYVWNGWPEDLWAQTLDFDAQAMRSAAYGFSYDLLPVVEQINACRKIISEFTPLLEEGYGDVDAILLELNTGLKEAGIDQVITEKQRQLDAWLAAGGIQ
ncbi:MAG: ABC transporter substrate-binding protein [Oscillospiraceae bacterium]|nr:ABC transporter substrate-binding protein [Oscillospiraceae bacterium]